MKSESESSPGSWSRCWLSAMVLYDLWIASIVNKPFPREVKAFSVHKRGRSGRKRGFWRKRGRERKQPTFVLCRRNSGLSRAPSIPPTNPPATDLEVLVSSEVQKVSAAE